MLQTDPYYLRIMIHGFEKRESVEQSLARHTQTLGLYFKKTIWAEMYHLENVVSILTSLRRLMESTTLFITKILDDDNDNVDQLKQWIRYISTKPPNQRIALSSDEDDDEDDDDDEEEEEDEDDSNDSDINNEEQSNDDDDEDEDEDEEDEDSDINDEEQSDDDVEASTDSEWKPPSDSEITDDDIPIQQSDGATNDANIEALSDSADEAINDGAPIQLSPVPEETGLPQLTPPSPSPPIEFLRARPATNPSNPPSPSTEVEFLYTKAFDDDNKILDNDANTILTNPKLRSKFKSWIVHDKKYDILLDDTWGETIFEECKKAELISEVKHYDLGQNVEGMSLTMLQVLIDRYIREEDDEQESQRLARVVSRYVDTPILGTVANLFTMRQNIIALRRTADRMHDYFEYINDYDWTGAGADVKYSRIQQLIRQTKVIPQMDGSNGNSPSNQSDIEEYEQSRNELIGLILECRANAPADVKLPSFLPKNDWIYSLPELKNIYEKTKDLLGINNSRNKHQYVDTLKLQQEQEEQIQQQQIQQKQSKPKTRAKQPPPKPTATKTSSTKPSATRTTKLKNKLIQEILAMRLESGDPPYACFAKLYEDMSLSTLKKEHKHCKHVKQMREEYFERDSDSYSDMECYSASTKEKLRLNDKIIKKFERGFDKYEQ